MKRVNCVSLTVSVGRPVNHMQGIFVDVAQRLLSDLWQALCCRSLSAPFFVISVKAVLLADNKCFHNKAITHWEAQCSGEYAAILVECLRSDSRWRRWPWSGQGKGNQVKGLLYAQWEQLYSNNNTLLKSNAATCLTVWGPLNPTHAVQVSSCPCHTFVSNDEPLLYKTVESCFARKKRIIRYYIALTI